MSKLTPHIISIVALIFLYGVCFPQSGVSVKASINRDKIMIGEPVELKLEARVPLDTDARWFPVDSIAHFEFIDKGKIDTSFSSAVKIYRQTLTITSFDSGRWELPAFPLAIGNRDYLTDSLPVSVAYSNFDPKQDYHDIKDIVEVENTAVPYVNWILLGLAIVSLLAIIYFLRKKVTRLQATVAVAPQAKLSPLQEALESLTALQQKEYDGLPAVKIFHTALNNVLRRYFYRKTGVATMEKTSGELMLQLKTFNLPADDFTGLAQVLRMNDAVKFARYLPAATENQQALETIKNAVQQLDTIIS